MAIRTAKAQGFLSAKVAVLLRPSANKSECCLCCLHSAAHDKSVWMLSQQLFDVQSCINLDGMNSAELQSSRPQICSGASLVWKPTVLKNKCILQEKHN